jgi:hypothetical protein
MPHSRSKNGVASLAYGKRGIQHAAALVGFTDSLEYWIPRFRGMTESVRYRQPNPGATCFKIDSTTWTL